MRNIIIICFVFWSFTSSIFAQNVGINASGVVPDASAMLDVDVSALGASAKKGVLFPRVALTSVLDITTIPSPATSLYVYNTATAGTSPNNVVPGFYYWNGTKWIAMSGNGGNDWSLIGNAGTSPSGASYGSAATNNFLGTLDAQDLTFVTNGMERMRIKTDNGQNLRIGMGTAFTANYNASATSSILHLNDWGTTANDFAAFNLSNSGTTVGNLVGVINFAAAGATGAATVDRKTSSIESNLTALSGANVSGDLRFFTNDASSFTEKMRILSNGNVGIGTTTPVYRLDLGNGTFGFGNSDSRTETRNDAGLQGNAGAQSGFFETTSPVNYPAGATSWWHLIDSRHSNTTNNYALQISGSFFDQKLYYRKTNNNASEPWNEILSSANNPVSVSLNSDYIVNTNAYTNVTGMTVTFTATKSTALVQFTCSGYAYTNSMAYVLFRIFNSTSGSSIGGTNTHMQNHDNSNGTVTPWSCSFSKNISGLTPGTSYTLVVQGSRGGILGTLNAVINASTMSDSQHMTLTVFP